MLGCCVCVHWITIGGTLDELPLLQFCQGMNNGILRPYLQALRKIVIDIAIGRVRVAVNQEIRFVSGNLTSPYSWQHQ